MLPTSYQTFYVYYHVHPDTGEIFYIGIGQFERAWNFKRFTSRGEEHATYCTELYSKGHTPEQWVKIVHRNLKKEDAVSLERDYIQKHKPQFNKIHNPDYKFSSKFDEVKEFAKELRSLGYSYTRIAYLLGGESLLSRKNKKAMSIWRMINE